MDVKITRNYAAYQNMMNAGKDAGRKPQHLMSSVEPKIRNDQIHISTDGLRKQEAAGYASTLSMRMTADQQDTKVEDIRQQIQDGSYGVSPEMVARKMLSGR